MSLIFMVTFNFRVPVRNNKQYILQLQDSLAEKRLFMRTTFELTMTMSQNKLCSNYVLIVFAGKSSPQQQQLLIV